MTVRRTLTVLVIVFLVSLAIILSRKDVPKTIARGQSPHEKPAGIPARPGPPPVSTPAPDRRDLDGQPALAAPDPGELSATEPPPPLAGLLGAPGTRPEVEPQMVLDVLNAFRRTFGVYPAGEDNRQFVNALLGANRDNLPFLPRDHPRLNARGEIVDAWGTPFFFHLNSRTSIEVRSAGADRRMFTADDIVAGKAPDPSGQFAYPDDEPASR